MKREYYVKHNENYFIETHIQGIFYKTRSIENATPFYRLDDAICYVQEEIRLPLEVIEIIEKRITEVVEEVVLVTCSHCGKVFDRRDTQQAKAELDSETEVYCESCFEEVDEAYGLLLCDEDGELIK